VCQACWGGRSRTRGRAGRTRSRAHAEPGVFVGVPLPPSGAKGLVGVLAADPEGPRGFVGVFAATAVDIPRVSSSASGGIVGGSACAVGGFGFDAVVSVVPAPFRFYSLGCKVAGESLKIWGEE
jgi:hypothetical protein